MTKVTVLLLFLFVIVALLYPPHRMEYRYNGTGSMPYGWYHITSLHDGAVVRGSLVAICPSHMAARIAKQRHYLTRGECESGFEPFLKQVVGISGDRIVVSRQGVSINGHFLSLSARVGRDFAGQPLEHIADGHYILARGQLWLYAPIAHSWDSRYYGPQQQSDVLGQASPMFTWGP